MPPANGHSLRTGLFAQQNFRYQLTKDNTSREPVAPGHAAVPDVFVWLSRGRERVADPQLIAEAASRKAACIGSGTRLAAGARPPPSVLAADRRATRAGTTEMLDRDLILRPAKRRDYELDRDGVDFNGSPFAVRTATSRLNRLLQGQAFFARPSAPSRLPARVTQLAISWRPGSAGGLKALARTGSERTAPLVGVAGAGPALHRNTTHWRAGALTSVSPRGGASERARLDDIAAFCVRRSARCARGARLNENEVRTGTGSVVARLVARKKPSREPNSWRGVRRGVALSGG